MGFLKKSFTCIPSKANAKEIAVVQIQDRKYAYRFYTSTKSRSTLRLSIIKFCRLGVFLPI